MLHRRVATSSKQFTTSGPIHSTFSSDKYNGAFPHSEKSETNDRDESSEQQQQQQQRRHRVRRSNKSSDSSILTITWDDCFVGCVICLVLVVAALVCTCAFVAVRVWQGHNVVNPLGLFGFQTPTSLSVASGSGSDGARQQGINDDDQVDEWDKMYPVLPASPIYTIPKAMAHIGDKSDRYASLRKKVDEQLPYDPIRSIQAMKSLRRDKLPSTHSEDLSYDIYNCPDQPPPGYPYEWSTTQILKAWNPDNVTVPQTIHQGLCIFDFRRDYIRALTYRNAEVPFVVTGDPDVAAAVERWNAPTYLAQLLGDTVGHRAEVSESNHFMFWMPPDAKKKKRQQQGQENSPFHQATNEPPTPDDWEPPTKMIRMNYMEWLKHANVTEEYLVEPDAPHWYFRLIGCGETGPTGNCDTGSSEWLFDELTFFQPKPQSLYLTDPDRQKGIHCRFGMTGVTVANHFDGSRNAIAVLGGERRYILSHPQNCDNLCLYPKGHPSARHSAVDWSQPDLDKFPDFAKAKSNEVLLQPGDVLYLPTAWFHYIVSLSLNYQCNTRSGTTNEYMSSIAKCGF